MLLAVQIECLDLDARYILRGERIIAENDEIGNHTGCKRAAFILLMAHIRGICRYHAQRVETRYALVRIGMIYGARHTVQGLWTCARSVGAVAYDKSEAVHRSQRVQSVSALSAEHRAQIRVRLLLPINKRRLRGYAQLYLCRAL